jgi:hypothetical protein
MPIAEAVINARWKGVSVSVFVEQDYIRTTLKKVPKPPKRRRLPAVRPRRTAHTRKALLVRAFVF